MISFICNVFSWEPKVDEDDVWLPVFILFDHDVLRLKVVESSTCAVDYLKSVDQLLCDFKHGHQVNFALKFKVFL